MTSSFRRATPLIILFFLALMASTPLLAYPVSITINLAFSEIPGQQDPLGLGNPQTPATAVITTTIPSTTATGSSFTYTGQTLVLTIPQISFIQNVKETGTVTISTNGQILANFSSGGDSFTATVIIPGLTLPTPSAISFGTKNFSAPASTTSYNISGAIGVVGITGTISAVGLTATPLSGISATAAQNGSAPSPQQISVGSNNSATPSIGYTATVSPSSATWLTLSGANGTTPGTVNANFSTALSPGTYTASVLVNDSGDTVGPISIPVTYTVTSPGTGSGLQVSPGSVTFNFFLPSSVAGSQTIEVTSTGAAAGYTAAVSGASFITVSPTSGTTPGSIKISGNGTGLSNGTYHATVTLTSTVGTAAIPVTINVTGGTGGGTGGTSPIGVSPSTITFNVSPGQTAPAPQTVKLTSKTPVSFSLGNVALYLPITPLSGNTPATLSVPLNLEGLTPGTHIDYVQIQSGGTYAQLTVTVNVSSVSLSTTTTGLAYVYPATASFPLTQTVTITQSGGAAVPLTVTPTVPWLTSTVSGDTVTLTANPDGLAQGTLSASVVIASPLGSNSVTIPVTFTLSSTPPGLVSVTPTAIAFAYQIGSAIPPTQTLQVSVLPAGSAYTISGFGASWLSVSTAGVVSVNPAGLVAGIYTGSVRVNGTNFANAPYFIPVTLTVSGSPTFGVSPSTLTFSAQPNGPAPSSQTIAMSSTVSNFISATTNVPWLSITPATAASPADFTVTATPGSLANGSYTGQITFTGGGAISQTVQMAVTLNISSVPAPVLTAVTNAMSYISSAGSPGGFIALWGTGIGPNPPVPLQLTNATTVSTTVGGTQVLANGIPCPLLFSSEFQVNAILPFSLAGQTSTQITVSYQGVVSNVLTIPIEPSAPGLFSLDGTGQNGGAILNSDLSVNSSSNPAPAGSIVVLYGGGAGQTSPAGSDGLIIPATSPIPAPVLPVTATVAGQPAQILYAGDAPDLVSGVLQVNVVVPAGTPSGPQPVVITVGTGSSQANLTVFVQ